MIWVAFMWKANTCINTSINRLSNSLEFYGKFISGHSLPARKADKRTKIEQTQKKSFVLFHLSKFLLFGMQHYRKWITGLIGFTFGSWIFEIWPEKEFFVDMWSLLTTKRLFFNLTKSENKWMFRQVLNINSDF